MNEDLYAVLGVPRSAGADESARDVQRLLDEGRTHQQIADALYMDPRTVGRQAKRLG